VAKVNGAHKAAGKWNTMVITAKGRRVRRRAEWRRDVKGQ
jgi:hypothetical protein